MGNSMYVNSTLTEKRKNNEFNLDYINLCTNIVIK